MRLTFPPQHSPNVAQEFTLANVVLDSFVTLNNKSTFRGNAAFSLMNLDNQAFFSSVSAGSQS